MYYEDILLYKVKRNRKILIKRYNSDKEIIFSDLKVVKEKNLIIDTIDNDKNYDIVIFENLFYSNENIVEILDKYKDIDLIMFIENVSLTYKSRFEFLKECLGLNIEYKYIGDIFDFLMYNNRLKVIDNYRLETKNTYLLSRELFLITTTLM